MALPGLKEFAIRVKGSGWQPGCAEEGRTRPPKPCSLTAGRAAPDTGGMTPPAIAPPLQIFTPGEHTAMSGQRISFTEADLRATVAAYRPALHEAPLVVGHPRHDLPAYGWVQALQFSDGGLDATPAQVNPDFAEMVAAGAFKKISASFYAPDAPGNPVPGVFYLRHVGFLGAQPPAVKGMRPPSFADDEAGVLTFGELDEAAGEAADPVPSPSVQPAAPLFAYSIPPIPEPQPPEPAVTPEQATALEAENTRLRHALAANKTAQAHAGHVAFCEDLASQAKLLPASQPVAVALLDHLAAQETPVEFGEGEAKAPLLAGFMQLLAAQPAQLSFGDHATAQRAAIGEATVEFAAPPGYGVEPLGMALHRKAVAYQATHSGTAYVDAVKAVS